MRFKAVLLLLQIAYLILLPFMFILYFGKKFYRANIRSYFGFPDVQGRGKKVLFHSVSVGEINSADWLIERYSRENYRIIISTTCEDGFELIQRKFPCAEVVVFPLDFILTADSFLRQIDPDLVIVCETDFWPSFMYCLKNRNIPVILLNGRISKKAALWYRILGFFMKELFIRFDHLFVQSDLDRRRLLKIGVSPGKLTVTGNTKLYISAFEQVESKNDRKIVVAGSTHHSDEVLLSQIIPFVDHLIIAPRKMRRIKEVRQFFQERLATEVPALYSECRDLSRISARVVIIDTMGDLQQIYSHASLFSYVGGGFEKTGLHNIIEPLRHYKPVVFGGNTHNFNDVAKGLLENGIAFQVNNEQELLSLARSLEKGLSSDYRSRIDRFFKTSSRNQEIIYHAINRFI